MVDVFISYASGDRERVKPIVDQIELAGWQVWWDRDINAGTAFDREIEKAIDDAKCIVVVWSAHSIESEWVRTEANEGLEKGNLVPVAIENVRPPLAFRRIQTIDLTSPNAALEMRDAISRFAAPAAQSTDDLTPFVARTQERQRAEDALDKASAGDGKMLLIGGEVGVGKTRLVRELAASARRNGFMVLSGQCLEMEGSAPYQPLLDQITQAARVTRPENLRRALGENAPEVAKLMPELRQQFDDIPEAALLPPEQERRYLLNGVGDFIDRAARMQPMMLIYEDLHWADDSTCILLRHLSQRFRETPILIVGTYRDNELDPNKAFAGTLRELTRERLVDEIILKCLSEEGVRQIIEGRSRKAAPAELVHLVFTETEGNPFFVEEVYRHLEEAGKLFDDNGDFKSGVEIRDTEVPRGVQLVIGERLERLSDTCRSVLTIGAVAGRSFSFEVLLRTGSKKIDEDDVLDAVEEGLVARLLEDLSVDRDARYGFVHEQIRQTLLMGLSLPRRQRIHLRVAGAMLEIYGDRADDHAGELGYHLYQAGAAADIDQTVHFLVEAGRKGLDALAFEDAKRRFDSAVEILPPLDDRLPVVYRLQSEALCGMGRIEESLTVLDEARELCGSAERDAIILQRCKMLLDVWRGGEAVDDLEQLLETKKGDEDRASELEVRWWLSRAYYVMSLDRAGYAEKARDSYHETIDLARELDNKKILAHALIATVQLIDYDIGYNATARAHLAEAEQIGTELGDEEIEIDAVTARLSLSFGAESDELGETVLTRLIARRDPVRLNAHYFRMMWSTLSGIQLARCLEICDAGIELAYRIGTLPVQYATIKGMALLDLGRFDDALVSIGKEIADEEHPFGSALQKLGEFQYLLECAAFEPAMLLAPNVIDESIRLNRKWMLAWISTSLAVITPQLIGEPEVLAKIESLIARTGSELSREGKAALSLAKDSAEVALELVRESQKPLKETLRTRVDISRADIFTQVLIAVGDLGGAGELLEKAIAVARQAGHRRALWRLLALAAKVSYAENRADEAAPQLEEAKAIHAAIAGTISNPAHRRAFEQDRVAIGLNVI